MITCQKCLRELSEDNFLKNLANKSGHTSRCIECISNSFQSARNAVKIEPKTIKVSVPQKVKKAIISAPKTLATASSLTALKVKKVYTYPMTDEKKAYKKNYDKTHERKPLTDDQRKRKNEYMAKYFKGKKRAYTPEMKEAARLYYLKKKEKEKSSDSKQSNCDKENAIN